jgi:hypothetical protein
VRYHNARLSSHEARSIANRKPLEDQLGIPEERIYPIIHQSPGSERYKTIDLNDLQYQEIREEDHHEDMGEAHFAITNSQHL